MTRAAHALAYFGAGAISGIGLVISGMSDPGKVTDFLDLAGRWDPSLAFVMLGAMLTHGLGRRLVLRRPQPLLGGTLTAPHAGRVDGRLVLGSILFGVAWGLVGLCPGPALVSLARLQVEPAGFVVAMLFGMFVARKLFAADSPLAVAASGHPDQDQASDSGNS